MASLLHLSCTSILPHSPSFRYPQNHARSSILFPLFCSKTFYDTPNLLPYHRGTLCNQKSILAKSKREGEGEGEGEGERQDEFIPSEEREEEVITEEEEEERDKGQRKFEEEDVLEEKGRGQDQAHGQGEGENDDDSFDDVGGEEIFASGSGITKRRRRRKRGTCEHVVAECRVETISWRERLVIASILIEAPPLTVWKVLTDYEKLSDFIPNLVYSQKIPCPYPGHIWLLQQGVQRTMYWNIEAHVILDLQEYPDMETGSELHFSMVDGDFKRYHGKWYLRTGPRPGTTMLHYEVNVVPKLFFPATFVENIIKEDLPKNLSAIAKRAEIEAESDGKVVGGLRMLKASNEESAENCTVSTSSPENDHINKRDSFAITKVKMNDSRVIGFSSKESNDIINLGAPYLWSGFGRTCQLSQQRFIDEIHFRRLDNLLENGVVHRQVVATVTVKAPSKDVWAVLTAYEDLPEFIPNLTKSVVLSRDKESVRILQEGCKCLLYVILHARVVLDLLERPQHEIVFNQVEGDFESFEGNWVLNQFGSRHTVLKYTVDMRIRKDCVLAESIVEEVIYEDLPSNLCAIRDRAENLTTVENSSGICLGEATFDFDTVDDTQQTEGVKDSIGPTKPEIIHNTVDCLNGGKSKAARSKPRKKRIHDKRLVTDFGSLEKEIRSFIASYGTEGVMPLRRLMRQHGRTDLEKAVTAMGGFRTVALRMKLSLAYKERKPDGYWDDVQNLRNEIIAVQKELGGDPNVLPSRLSIEKLGHYHIARALEKWGGAKETAKILGLKTQRMQNREQQLKKKATLHKLESSSIFVDVDLGTKMKENERRLNGNVVKDPSITRSKRDWHAASTYLKEASSDASDFGVCSSVPRVISDEQRGNDASLLDCNEPSHLDDSDLSSSNELKQKKMPYKTNVPQESSKWLTLFRDSR